MSPRRAGSGQYTRAALAIEKLWAAHLAGTSKAGPMRVLREERAIDRCPVPPATLDRWLGSLTGQLSWQVQRAIQISPFAHADVEVILSSGERRWFEAKSPMSKKYTQITETDYIRDDTDFLGRLAETDAAGYRTHVGAGLASWLTAPRSGSTYYAGWRSLESLYLADLAGLRTRAARTGVAVRTRADLDDYIDSKYFLQVTSEGARVCALRDLAPIRAVRSGYRPQLMLRDNKTGRGLWVLDPDSGRAWSSYNLYRDRRGPYGRHKMHALAFEGVGWVNA